MLGKHDESLATSQPQHTLYPRKFLERDCTLQVNAFRDVSGTFRFGVVSQVSLSGSETSDRAVNAKLKCPLLSKVEMSPEPGFGESGGGATGHSP